MSISMLSRSSGRPRGFDDRVALTAARTLFWERGYEATSLDDLLAAMRISRSSFYACFGSKHTLLTQSLRLYVDESLAELDAIVAAAATPQAALRNVFQFLADPAGGRRGCFLANCITEFGPHDAEVEAIVALHMARLTAVVTPLMPGNGPDRVARTRLFVAMVLGVVALRKVGLTTADLQSIIDNALLTFA